MFLYPNPLLLSLRVGDLLMRPKGDGLIDHVGVFIGNGQVVHNSPQRGEHVSTLDEFAAGHPITTKSTGAHPDTVFANVMRILSNPKPYCPLTRNCEHTANDLLARLPESPQLQAAIGLGALALFVGYLFSQN